MKFSDLKECPFCGNKEFYTTRQVTGISTYNERFDGKEAEDNSCMYDALNYSGGALAYCNNCFSFLGNRNSDKLGKRAEKALAGRGEK